MPSSAVVPGGVSAGHVGPRAKLAGVRVPGGVLLPLACKGGCPSRLSGSRDAHGVGGRLWLSPVASGSPQPVGDPAVGCSPPVLSSMVVFMDRNELMKGNAIFRALSLIKARVPAPGHVNRLSRWAFPRGGWSSLSPSVPVLQGHPPPQHVPVHWL